jgi:hypothetical protein
VAILEKQMKAAPPCVVGELYTWNPEGCDTSYQAWMQNYGKLLLCKTIGTDWDKSSVTFICFGSKHHKTVRAHAYQVRLAKAEHFK